MSNTNKFQTSQIFKKAAKETGFNCAGITYFIEYMDYWLLINHQKSFYSKHFYINVGLFYKEFLTEPLNTDILKKAFKPKTDTYPHVLFRIEHCPGMPEDLTISIGRSVENEQSEKLFEILQETFMLLISFLNENNDRESIRKLYNDKKLSAMILKEV